jgi:putative flippase GtrA
VGIVAVWLGTVLNACLFAASQGADANLRYALSTVIAVQCALVVTLVLHATATTGGAGAVTRRPVPAGG